MTRTRSLALSAATAVTLVACLAPSLPAKAESGQRRFGQVTVEPAIDLTTGGTVYLLTPDKAPFPSKANPVATAPLYLPVYPLSSSIPADDFDCQPWNCDHVNVLPFQDPDYTVLDGSDKACVDFNNGRGCSPVKGHDHLVGIASTHGDFNVAWHVKMVLFTHNAFENGKINTRITTLDQISALVKSGDAMIVDTPVTFNCSSTSQATYEHGTPVIIPYP